MYIYLLLNTQFYEINAEAVIKSSGFEIGTDLWIILILKRTGL